MGFVLTDDQRLIAETTRSLLVERAGSARRRQALASGGGFDADLWDQATALGWAGIAIPEDRGGSGLGWADLAIVMEETGRELAMIPFFTTTGLAAPMVMAAADAPRAAALLPRFAAGLRATACLTGVQGRPCPDGVAVELRKDASGWRLNGEASYVAFGHVADLLVVAARAPDAAGWEGISLVVVDAARPGVRIERVSSLDLTRPYSTVWFDDAAIDRGAILGEPGQAGAALRRALAISSAMLAAEQLGAAQKALEMTVDYVSQRVQFGRPVGAFQAVKHKLADMAVWVETARSAVRYAAAAADDPDADLIAASAVARVHCTRALQRCAADAIQLHGGIGFTWDYDIQLYFKRARSSATLLGDVAHHQDEVARRLGLLSFEGAAA